MPFFHVGTEDEVKLVVDGQWWLYLAVTIPLTVMVFTLWWAWPRMMQIGRIVTVMSKAESLKV